MIFFTIEINESGPKNKYGGIPEKLSESWQQPSPSKVDASTQEKHRISFWLQRIVMSSAVMLLLLSYTKLSMNTEPFLTRYNFFGKGVVGRWCDIFVNE